MGESLFGAPSIPIDHIWTIEQGAPNLILWAAPIMFLLTAIEMAVTYFQENPFYEKWETVGSVLVGVGSVVIGLGIKLGLLYGLVWLYNQLPWRMALQWWTLIPCYVIFDFFSYWAHRISHEQRF